MSKKIKTFAIVVLIIAALIGGVSLMGNKSPDSTSGLSSSNKAAGVPLSTTSTSSNEFSSSLSTIKGISIDTSIFTNPAYLALRDYPVALGTEVVGRSNPFAPIGSDATAPVASGVQFETLQPAKITRTTAQFGAQAVLAATAQTSVVFEYGTSDLFGSATPPIPVTKSGTVLYSATGLIPDTTYYVRAVLAQGSITTSGNTMTFTTAAQ